MPDPVQTVAQKSAEVAAHGASSWPEFWAYLGRQSLMELLLVFVLVFMCMYLWRIQKASNNIDLIKLILTHGDPDPVKFALMTALLIGGWCIIHLAVAGQWSDTAFGIYMGAFAGTTAVQLLAARGIVASSLTTTTSTSTQQSSSPNPTTT